MLLALVDSLTWHFVARTVEAVGYVFLVIAAPAYLATHTATSHRPMVLALWGSFVPVGYALANVQEQFVTSTLGQAAFLPSAAVPLILFTVATLILVPTDADAAANRTKDTARASTGAADPAALRGALLLAAGFGIYVLLQMGFFTFLPAFAKSDINADDLSPATIALFVPVGNLAAALLLGVVPARLVPAVALAAFALSAACAMFLFRIDDPAGMPLYAGFAFLGGIIVSGVFGTVPKAASAGLSAAIVIGLIAQAGGLGTIAGPPLAGFLLDRYGWNALTWLLTGLSIVGTVAMLPLLRTPRSTRSQGE